jgi:hypothetical protein
MYDIIHAAIAHDRTRELVETANATRAARETGSPVRARKVAKSRFSAARVSLGRLVVHLGAH